MGWLEFVFKRVVVVLARLQQDGTARADIVHIVREKGKIQVERVVPDVEIEELGNMKLKEPTLLEISGYGVIRKVFLADDTEGMERVTGNGDLIHSSSSGEAVTGCPCWKCKWKARVRINRKKLPCF